MDCRIFHTAKDEISNSHDTDRALDEEQLELETLSTTVVVTSSTVSFAIGFRPLPGSTKFPVSSNFIIIFFKPCFDMGLFNNPFKLRYLVQLSYCYRSDTTVLSIKLYLSSLRPWLTMKKEHRIIFWLRVPVSLKGLTYEHAEFSKNENVIYWSKSALLFIAEIFSLWSA